MRRTELSICASVALFFSLIRPMSGASETQKIDVDHSKITVHVYKSGVFSAFAHNHEIESPIDDGTAQLSGTPSVELRVDARKLRVLDPEVSQDTRSQIQETMRGAQVLDVEHFPEIGFQSTKVEMSEADHWIVHGDLALHGKKRPITFDVTLKGGHFIGSANFKQTDFGIKPVRVAGGTVKVTDEVKVEFDIALIK
jgi:polyisoprenoid-binding protein YceI